MTGDDIALAERLADAAGAAIRPYFRAPHALELKDDATPVTLADRAAEAAMRSILEVERPNDGIIGEEFGSTRADADRVWVLDPIDGTRSFIAGRAIFGTLIALLDRGVPVAGVIDQPVQRERWVGGASGTTLNGVAASTRTCSTIESASVATTSPHQFAGDDEARFGAVAACATAMRHGPLYGGDCYNYALLASGYLDLVIESGLKVHDWAALVPVVEGAGGRMTDWAGEPLTMASDGRVIAAGDPRLIEVAVALLN